MDNAQNFIETHMNMGRNDAKAFILKLKREMPCKSDRIMQYNIALSKALNQYMIDREESLYDRAYANLGVAVELNKQLQKENKSHHRWEY